MISPKTNFKSLFVAWSMPEQSNGSSSQQKQYGKRGNMNDFPVILRTLRERERKKRKVLSELCGLPPDAIRRYEMGESKPTVDALIKIADYFDVTLDYLVGRKISKNTLARGAES